MKKAHQLRRRLERLVDQYLKASPKERIRLVIQKIRLEGELQEQERR